MKTLRAIQVGCGPIGCAVATLALKRGDFQLAGAVDIDPSKIGRDLAEVAGLAEKTGVMVTGDALALIGRTRPDVVFHTTGSSLHAVRDQLADLLRAGVNIVSTCEELAYPFWHQPELADGLHQVARTHGVTLLATGINPGFLMDAWPLAMTAVCQRVDGIRAERIQDASPRREPFQRKIGAGLTVDEFHDHVAQGVIRHVGLPESVAMIAAGLGWKLADINEEIEPVVAPAEVRSAYVTVPAGHAAGVRQVARGVRDGQEVITLAFQASLGETEPRDSVSISGLPDLVVVIPGGTHGDIGTVAVVVNAARRVVEAPPGLLTMKDLPPVHCV